MVAIVTGMIVSYPVGGVLWDYGQYALALEQLGFDVYYLEDTGWQIYDPVQRCYGENCSYGVKFLEQSLGQLSAGLEQRWHFRSMEGETYGIDAARFRDIVAGADLFLNVSGGTLLRDEYMPCPRKVLIDSDPGWNHFRNYPKWDANPNWYGTHGYHAHNHFFTYAECLGRAGCSLPDMGLKWQPTRPPVVLDCWQAEPPGRDWTTVMTWKNFQEPIIHNGTVYGTKEMEFARVEALPQHSSASFELAVGGDGAPVERWRQLGWSVTDSHRVSATADEYRRYIQQSRGEVSVAKNVYVATRSGWFSCRSTCYLAAGRPVVLQDTGFSDVLPAGDGILPFATLQDAARAVAEVERNYQHHQQAAREIARSCFDARVVLSELLERIGL
ncbi:MAG: glycosyltransferase [Verrucomicrobiales bacterium]